MLFIGFCLLSVLILFGDVNSAPPIGRVSDNDVVSGSVNGKNSLGIVIGARQSNVGVVLNGSGPITVNTNHDTQGPATQTTVGSNNGSNNGNNNGNGGGQNNGNGNGVGNVGVLGTPFGGGGGDRYPTNSAADPTPALVQNQPVPDPAASNIPPPVSESTPVPTQVINTAPINQPPNVGGFQSSNSRLPTGNGNGNGNGNGSYNGNSNGNGNNIFDPDFDIGKGFEKFGDNLAKNWNNFWGLDAYGAGGNYGSSNNGNHNGNGNGSHNGNHNGNGNGRRRRK